MPSLLPGMPNVALPNLSFITTLLTRDGFTQLAGASPQWGIYKGAAPVIVCDTVTSMEVRGDYDISDFPVEQGGFYSYNKVQIPVSVRFRFAIGGSDADRKALLDSVKAAVKTLDVYQATSPEASYQNMNLTHYDYQRTGQKGLGLLVVDVWMEEIRQTGQTEAANAASTQNAPGFTKTPQGANAVGLGSINPQPLTKDQTNAVPLPPVRPADL